MNFLKKIKIWMLAALFFGCSDSFVDDVDPLYSIDSENYFNNQQEYEFALIGVYDLLATTYVNVITAEIASDNALCGGENANDVPAWQEIDDMIHTDVNDQLRNVWNWMYAGINRANYIMEFQDKTDFDGKDVLLAETRFLRAYFYFELVKYFGDLPMPIDTRVSFGEASGYPRLPVSEVYAQIEMDLEFAVANLPISQPGSGRATLGAAQALLGKVFLYQDKFAESAEILELLIQQGTYQLADFNTLFLSEGENGTEAVFEVQYVNIEGAGFDCFQCSEGNIMVGFSGIRGYSGPLYASGFSFNLPTQELFDAFDPADTRLPVTVLDIDAWVAANPSATFTEGFEHTGYFNQKYIPRLSELGLGDANLTSPKNYRAIRYADVLLMAAEALNRGGISDPRALTYLNQVRTRAGLADLTSTGSDLTEAIYAERRLELAGEGHRFFDLVRTGRAASEIDGFTAGTHELFPIPRVEIELAGNVWAQNEGY